MKWPQRCVLLLLAAFSLSAVAATPLERLEAQLASGEVHDEKLLAALESSDGLFVRGWLYEQGAYGVPADPAEAQRAFLAAAKAGHAGALAYCWQRCLPEDALFDRQLDRAAARGDADALYLKARALVRDNAAAVADPLLLEAARGRQPDALNRLYVDHFLGWSRAPRDFADAEAKLRRCAEEGLTICYYLLGALYERHRHSEKALWAYRVFSLVDPDSFGTYLSPAELASLSRRLPQPSDALIKSRVAQTLISHPSDEFDRIARFKACRSEPSYACAARLARGDEHCIPPFGITDRAEFRRSPGYSRCLAEPAATE